MPKQLFIEEQQLEMCADLHDSHEDEPTIICYARSACEGQGTGLSLEMQRYKMMAALRCRFGNGFRVAWISEIGSGNRHFRDDPGGQCRPGLRLAAKLVEAGIAQHICVAQYNRIARDPRVFLDFLNLLVQHGVSLIGVAEETMASRRDGVIGSELVHLVMAMHLSGESFAEIAKMVPNHGEGHGCTGYRVADFSLRISDNLRAFPALAGSLGSYGGTLSEIVDMLNRHVEHGDV